MTDFAFAPALRSPRAPTLRLPADNARLLFYMAAILLVGYLFPSELTIKAGLSWTVHRLTLFIVAPIAALLLLRQAKIGAFVLCASDIAAFLIFLWCPIALYLSGGVEYAASISSFVGLDMFVSYMVGRVLFQDEASIATTLHLMLGIVVVLACFGLLDWIAHENVLPELAVKISGLNRAVRFVSTSGEAQLQNSTQFRFGLARARGPIEHSILFGAFFAVMAPLFLYGLKSVLLRVVAVGICAGGTILALSSAPILIFALFVGLASYDLMLQGVRWRWVFLALIAGFFVTTLLALTDDPIKLLIGNFTLDPTTGYVRLLIWSWVTKNLALSPIFGLGNGEWFRPADLLDSIDCLWLSFTLKYGYVGLALLFSTIFGSFLAFPRRNAPIYDTKRMRWMRTAFTIAILQWITLAFTVDVWGTPWSFLALMIGGRAALSQARYHRAALTAEAA